MGQFKLTQREWHPFKARKIDVLDFIHKKEAITFHDLIDEFDCSYWGAKRRIYLLQGKNLSSPYFKGVLTELAGKS